MRLLCFAACCVLGACSDKPPDNAYQIPEPIVACVPKPDASPWQGPCANPPSYCADGDWLVYFTNGECVEGQCAYTRKLYRCSQGCRGGTCVSYGSTPSWHPPQ